jgi:hypothetical protein
VVGRTLECSPRIVLSGTVSRPPSGPGSRLCWQRSRFIGQITLAACLLVIVSACGPVVYPSTVYSPEITGVVQTATVVDHNWSMTFSDGRHVAVTNDPRFDVYGGQPMPGDLAFIGSRPKLWWASLRYDPARSCYGIPDYAFDDGQTVTSRYGLRVPKAPDFSVAPGDQQGNRLVGGTMRCLNATGEAYRYA